MPDGLTDAFAYCLTTLRELNRDRYVACLLTPEAVRNDLAALWLFDLETARIRDLVHEPIPGEIRLQWWRDTLIDTGHGAGAGPLAHALKDVIARHHLPLQPFIDLLDARIFDLYDDPMGNVADFELYAGETASAIIQLSLLICDPSKARAGADASGHAGVALTVANVLATFGRQFSRGPIYVPAPMLLAAGLDSNTLKSSEPDVGKLDALVDVFVGFGQSHLEKARAAFAGKDLPIAPFLPSALIAPRLSTAKKRGVRILSEDVGPGPFKCQWTLWRAAQKKRF